MNYAAFGPWFERPPTEHPQQDLLTVDWAIDFLAPFFGVNVADDQWWDKVDLPEVVVGYPSYDVPSNHLALKIGSIEERAPVIGHEVGHWYHHTINPQIYHLAREIFWQNPRLGAIYKLWAEVIADYADVIYQHGKDPIKKPKFNLLELVNVSQEDFERLSQKDLSKFLVKTLFPLGGTA